MEQLVARRHLTHSTVRIMTAFALAMLGALLFTGCTRHAQSMDARQIEQQYGVTGAYSDTIATSDGPLKATLVPITPAIGREGFHTRLASQHATKRSWEKEALIIGGSAGAGTAIGALTPPAESVG
jgi:hypothetical protein